MQRSYEFAFINKRKWSFSFSNFNLIKGQRRRRPFYYLFLFAVARDLKATNEIVALLRMQLAEAYNLGDRNMVAQLHETLRCLSLFDNEACRKLVRSLKEDYKRRSPYLAYLGKCHALPSPSIIFYAKLLVTRLLCKHKVQEPSFAGV